MAAKPKKKSNEEILAIFNGLRTEQRQIANKIYDMESEHQEHKIVIEALKDTEPERKCFRMIGGVLVEGTVEKVLPNLIDNAKKVNNINNNHQFTSFCMIITYHVKSGYRCKNLLMQ
jgi:prefoldin subunit 2